MEIEIIIGILFIHWIGDFVFQSDWQAKNKSKNNIALTAHVASYSFCWLVACSMSVLLTDESILIILFPVITFVLHWITDYFTSRINSKLYAENKIHYFFVSIGFDQILHYVQLILTYKLLTYKLLTTI